LNKIAHVILFLLIAIQNAFLEFIFRDFLEQVFDFTPEIRATQKSR
jgi:hypothetical protein